MCIRDSTIAVQELFGSGLALSVSSQAPRQGRVAAPSIRRAPLASCWPLPQQLLPVSATGDVYKRQLYDLPEEEGGAEEEAVPDYPVTVFFTREGYLKKIPPQSLRTAGAHKLKEMCIRDRYIAKAFETAPLQEHSGAGRSSMARKQEYGNESITSLKLSLIHIYSCSFEKE